LKCHDTSTWLAERGNVKRTSLAVIGSFLAMLLGGCPFDIIHVEQTPAHLESIDATEKPFELMNEVKLDIGAGYHRILRRGTRWRCVGRIPQGNIYTTRDQVLTVEASNIQEAYIVVDSRKLMGFYLPVERTWGKT
jgi:hypothetical protein